MISADACRLLVRLALPNNPDYASIETGGAYVGNENTNGDSLAGVAFSFLSYVGAHANDVIDVKLEVGDLSFFGSVVLPAQFITIDLTAIPLHVDWINGSTTNKQTLIQITVKDAQLNPISNQAVTFTGSKGSPLAGDDPEDFVIMTDENGYSEMIWDFFMQECPPPAPDGTPGTTTAIVTAHVLGQGVTNNITIILIRYP